MRHKKKPIPREAGPGNKKVKRSGGGKKLWRCWNVGGAEEGMEKRGLGFRVKGRKTMRKGKDAWRLEKKNCFGSDPKKCDLDVLQKEGTCSEEKKRGRPWKEKKGFGATVSWPNGGLPNHCLYLGTGKRGHWLEPRDTWRRGRRAEGRKAKKAYALRVKLTHQGYLDRKKKKRKERELCEKKRRIEKVSAGRNQAIRRQLKNLPKERKEGQLLPQTE